MFNLIKVLVLSILVLSTAWPALAQAPAKKLIRIHTAGPGVS